MPRTLTTLAVCFCGLLAASAAMAQAPRGPASAPAWPTAGHAGGQSGANAGAPQGVQQAAYTAPLPTAPSSPPIAQHPTTVPTPLSPPQRKESEPLPLARRGHSPGASAGTSSSDALFTTLASLAVVLGLFFAVAWVLRRGAPPAMAALPGEVVEILGRAPLPGRQQMHLVRCGHKLLLVAISATGADTLTEITDPLEVDRLCGLCRQTHPHSATATFRNLLNQFGPDSAPDRKPRYARAIEDDDA